MDLFKTAVISNLIVILLFLIIIKKYIKIAKAILKIKNEEHNKYSTNIVDEIPDEVNATPARSLCLIENDISNRFSINLSEAFSATVFDLWLKRIINIEIIDNNVEIGIEYVGGTSSLPEDEKVVYDLLVDAIGDNKTIDLKQLQTYAEENCEKFYKKTHLIETSAKNYIKNFIVLNEEDKKKMYLFGIQGILYLIIFSVLITLLMLLGYGYIANVNLKQIVKVVTIYTPTIYLAVIICSALCFLIADAHRNSEELYRRADQWSKFYKHLSRFSSENKNEELDVKKIEKFLVYATGFGISKKFMEEVSKVYPNILTSDYAQEDNNKYYEYWKKICSSNINGKNSFDYIRCKLESIYKNARKKYLGNYDDQN